MSACFFGWVLFVPGTRMEAADVERFGVFEAQFEASGSYENPYTQLAPVAEIQRPDGAVWKIPLFWDGEKTWKLRVSPDLDGEWRYRVESSDDGLRGKEGSFRCQTSRRNGSIRPMVGFPHHFQYQDGTPFWFLGDTAWALYTDQEEENHHREAVEHYTKARAAQGFNVIHSMLLSEAGWENLGGPPFEDIAEQRISVGYWKEVDRRLRLLNEHGIIGGLVLAWGNKRDVEPYSWGRFPGRQARLRYARYVAARYSAFDIYFVVSGEWHAEVRTRENEPGERIRQEFVEVGEILKKADPHSRMITIHPMADHGSVREFAGTSWASFADYQQSYRSLHERVLLSRPIGLPVVNSEYAYFLRDQNEDGIVDKPNSYTPDDIRAASWDIVMGGGYFVTGFGSTYFGGYRHPGTFDLELAANDQWEYQAPQIKRFFSRLEWWKLVPADRLLASEEELGADRVRRTEQRGTPRNVVQPPERAYWALMEPGNVYVVYLRGVSRPVELFIEAVAGDFSLQRLNPRTGELSELDRQFIADSIEIIPPDEKDWVYLLRRIPKSTSTPN